MRDAYEKHMAKVLELSGIAASDAAKQAKAVLAFETRLAKASKSQEDLSRDMSLYYHPVSIADADQPTPNFPVRKSVVEGESVSVRVDLGGRRSLKKKNKKAKQHLNI